MTNNDNQKSLKEKVMAKRDWQADIDDANNKIALATQDIAGLEKAISKREQEKTDATQHLYDKVNEIEKQINLIEDKHNASIKRLNVDVAHKEKIIAGFQRHQTYCETQRDWIALQKKGAITNAYDFVVWMRVNLDTVRKYDVDKFTMVKQDIPTWEIWNCKEHGINRILEWNIQVVKQALPNGVVLVRVFRGWFDGKASDSDWVKYFAFYGLTLIGMHHTCKAEHRGDNAQRWSWTLKKHLSDAVDEKPNTQWNRRYTFREWQEMVGSLDTVKLNKFSGMDTDDEKNCIELLKTFYGW